MIEILIAALIAGTAHGPLTVECKSTLPVTGRLGWASPWNDSITLDVRACNGFKRVAQHKAKGPVPDPPPGAMRRTYARDPLDAVVVRESVMIALHEAAHVGQWREGICYEGSEGCPEHDAECRALDGLAPVLKRLGYGPRVRARMDAWMRQDIRTALPGDEEYTGECPRLVWNLR